MPKYTWAGIPYPDAISSGRMSAEILAAYPDMVGLGLDDRRDAAIAELCAETAGAGSFTSITADGAGTLSADPANPILSNTGKYAGPSSAGDGNRMFAYYAKLDRSAAGGNAQVFIGYYSEALVLAPGTTLQKLINHFIGAETVAVTNYSAGIEIEARSGGAVNNYGLFIGDVTGTGAFAIKTGVGKVWFSDHVAIGQAPEGTTAFLVGGTFGNTTGASQVGSYLLAAFDRTATADASCCRLEPYTEAFSSYTMAQLSGLRITNVTKGAGCTITTQYGIQIEDQTRGVTNYAIFTNAGLVSLGGDIILRQAINLIVTDTVDGSDTKDVGIGSGGALGASRGAYIALNGNESPTVAGELLLVAGNVASTGIIEFSTGGVSVWQFNASGHFLASTDNSFDIGVSADFRPRDVHVARDVKIAGSYFLDGTQVVSNRVTGYTNAMTGTANRATSYDTGTITLVQLAERVKAVTDDLRTHGLIGA